MILFILFVVLLKKLSLEGEAFRKTGGRCMCSHTHACLCSPVYKFIMICLFGFPGGSEGKASVCNTGDPGLIPGLGRSPGEGNGSPLQYSCLENPMDGGVW